MTFNPLKRIVLAAAFLVAAVSCARTTVHIKDSPVIEGSGVVKTEDRTLSQFSSIRIEGAADVLLTQATAQKVTVETDDNLIPIVETEVKNGTLIISTKESYRTRKGLRVHVSIPDIRQLEIRGAGDIHGVTPLKVGDLGIKIVGAGDVDLDVTAHLVQTSIEGSGDITLTGKAENLSTAIAGSGDFHGYGLLSDAATISIMGSGDGEIHANKSLSAAIHGSGDVRYKGAVKDVKSSVSGVGGVRRGD